MLSISSSEAENPSIEELSSSSYFSLIDFFGILFEGCF